ncbi:hypothetical protein A7981_05745 [Methylovorus sp. MM2]|nr:hypothetical protein A7981_05745 [Methylovorus sp. MM2]
MIKAIDLRFFSHCFNEQGEQEIVEVTEAQFLALKETPNASISYARHSVHTNGVRQVCLTVDVEDCPHLEDLERFKS